MSCVMDFGSSLSKLGFSSDPMPRSMMPTVVGRQRNYRSTNCIEASEHKDVYVGEGATSKRGVLRLLSPVERGVVVRWDDMELLMEHAFENILRIEPALYPLLIIDKIGVSAAQREKMCQLAFEYWNVQHFFCISDAACGLFNNGFSTGVTLDSGEGLTVATPIYEGHALPYASIQIPISGRDITDQLSRLLQTQGINLTSSGQLDIVRDMKEKSCYISQNYIAEYTHLSSCDPCVGVPYVLPDHTQIRLTSEVIQAPELLFRPNECGYSHHPSVPQLIANSIAKADPSLRKLISSNIVITGGTTMMRGFPERLENEMTRLLPPCGIKFHRRNNREYGAWFGGSVVCELSTFNKMWITAQEYDEKGPTIVHTYCF